MKGLWTTLAVGSLLVLSACGQPAQDSNYASGEVTPTVDVSVERNIEVDMGTLTPARAGEMVEYYADKGVEGYLAMPELAEGETAPALILIHEWWGLNDHIKDMADRYAAEGYIALAVDMYDGRVATEREDAGTYAGEVRGNIDEALNNLSAAVSFLNGMDMVQEGNLGTVGWCFGGQWALRMALNDLGVKATVMYYGQIDMEGDYEMMRSSIIGHFGEEDTGIAVDTVEEFQAKLDTLNGDHEVYIYPNAGHAFANDTREDAYNEEAADLAWERTQDFLNRVLGQ